MSDGVIVAIITGVLSLAGVIITSINNRKKISADFQRNSELADARLETKLAVIDTRLNALTEEVRKHNNFASRMPTIEEKVAHMEKRVDYLESLGG